VPQKRACRGQARASTGRRAKTAELNGTLQLFPRVAETVTHVTHHHGSGRGQSHQANFDESCATLLDEGDAALDAPTSSNGQQFTVLNGKNF
jgi:hypothetical protein